MDFKLWQGSKQAFFFLCFFFFVCFVLVTHGVFYIITFLCCPQINYARRGPEWNVQSLSNMTLSWHFIKCACMLCWLHKDLWLMWRWLQGIFSLKVKKTASGLLTRVLMNNGVYGLVLQDCNDLPDICSKLFVSPAVGETFVCS